MRNRDEYVENLKTKLDRWNAEIDELDAKARKAKADASQDYRERMESLNRKREDARKKLEEIRDATGDAWATLREGAERTWAELAKTLRETKDAVTKSRAGS